MTPVNENPSNKWAIYMYIQWKAISVKSHSTHLRVELEANPSGVPVNVELDGLVSKFDTKR
jgi:hypothetical protein